MQYLSGQKMLKIHTKSPKFPQTLRRNKLPLLCKKSTVKSVYLALFVDIIKVRVVLRIVRDVGVRTRRGRG